MQDPGGAPGGREPLVSAGPPEAEKRGRSASGSGDLRKPWGGFQVKFEPMGAEAHRAVYRRGERTIYINLDHPQLLAARGIGGTEDPAFRRLSYEVAFSEYAIALASERAVADHYLEPGDAIYEIRDTLNRVACKGASLYSQ